VGAAAEQPAQQQQQLELLEQAVVVVALIDIKQAEVFMLLELLEMAELVDQEWLF
jgi:hypothetical protein